MLHSSKRKKTRKLRNKNHIGGAGKSGVTTALPSYTASPSIPTTSQILPPAIPAGTALASVSTNSSRINKTFTNSRCKNAETKYLILDKTIPTECSSPIFELLWLNAKPNTVQLTLQEESGVNKALKEIMFSLGANEDILNTVCFVICGPTAVGKTKFINKLKEKYNAETINMDTMQIFDGISVGTGRTNLATTKGSYIYGNFDPNKQFHILDYLRQVFQAVKTIKEHGNPIIFEGASKSLLDVLMRIFPNLIIFGIYAISEENIIFNVTKRITELGFVKPAILELADLLRKNKITYNSLVLKNNPEVYTLIISTFSKDELLDANLEQKLTTVYAQKLKDLTQEIVQRNINLHKQQFARLKTIPTIKWFSNSDSSIEVLENEFKQIIDKVNTEKTILVPTSDFTTVPIELCATLRKNPGRKTCEDMGALTQLKNTTNSIQFAAKLNIPLLPKKGTQQIVIGTTKYLLPYAVLPEYFKMFAFQPDQWTLDKNIILLECIASRFINNPIIRILTTPEDLIDENGSYRITANEICILKTYSYNFYKYDSIEFPNVYFASKSPLVNCVPIDTSDGVFRCKGEVVGQYLYF